MQSTMKKLAIMSMFISLFVPKEYMTWLRDFQEDLDIMMVDLVIPVQTALLYCEVVLLEKWEMVLEKCLQIL